MRDRSRFSAAAAERLLALPEISAAHLVLAYCATSEEIDPAPAVAGLRELGIVVSFPRVSGAERLTLHRVDEDSSLVQGPFGLLEPDQGTDLVDPQAVDLAIVPGVAFDVSCRRVGHGGGYYDRLLPALDRATVIGLAFDCQVFAQIPTHDHDVCVDVLVTPSRTIRRPSGPAASSTPTL